MAGRPPDKDRKTTSYTIHFPSQDFINSLDEIAASLGLKRKDFVLKVLEEGMEKYEQVRQTEIVAYAGIQQEMNNVFNDTKDFFRDRAVIDRKVILEYLMEQGVPGKERVAMTERLLAHFKSKGATIYR